MNVPVGTIFSIVKKVTKGKHGELADLLQPGRKQVAAGYVIYGSSTMLVYTTGQGAHGFTLDPSIGEFLLSHPNIRTPDEGRYLSVNDSYEQHWEEPVRTLMRRYRGLEGGRKPLSVRYVGSLVADFHRNLLGGGVFCYPANAKRPTGKLRLLYEANRSRSSSSRPAGRDRWAAACSGLQPAELHHAPPLYMAASRTSSSRAARWRALKTLVGA